jgi:hypothetical protein
MSQTDTLVNNLEKPRTMFIIGIIFSLLFFLVLSNIFMPHLADNDLASALGLVVSGFFFAACLPAFAYIDNNIGEIIAILLAVCVFGAVCIAQGLAWGNPMQSMLPGIGSFILCYAIMGGHWTYANFDEIRNPK